MDYYNSKVIILN